MGVLQDLPNELLIPIFNDLDWESQFSTRQACRRFMHILAPSVFQEFQLFEGIDEYSTIAQMVRSSLEGHFTTHVTAANITLAHENCTWPPLADAKAVLRDDEDIKFVYDSLIKKSTRSDDIWAHLAGRLEEHGYLALPAILMSEMINLESLQISFKFNGMSTRIFFRVLELFPFAFEKTLSKVQIHYSALVHMHRPELIPLFASMPNVEEIMYVAFVPKQGYKEHRVPAQEIDDEDEYQEEDTQSDLSEDTSELEYLSDLEISDILLDGGQDDDAQCYHDWLQVAHDISNNWEDRLVDLERQIINRNDVDDTPKLVNIRVVIAQDLLELPSIVECIKRIRKPLRGLNLLFGSLKCSHSAVHPDGELLRGLDEILVQNKKTLQTMAFNSRCNSYLCQPKLPQIRQFSVLEHLSVQVQYNMMDGISPRTFDFDKADRIIDHLRNDNVSHLKIIFPQLGWLNFEFVEALFRRLDECFPKCSRITFEQHRKTGNFRKLREAIEELKLSRAATLQHHLPSIDFITPEVEKS